MALAPARILANSKTWLGLAHIAETALPFVRNIALARLLEPREFALALALASVVGMAEMVGDVGLPQYALRADAANARFRNTLHSLALLRSFFLAILIVLAAYPLEWLFQAPGAALAFALAGLTVAVRGFANLATRQVTRDGRYGPEAAAILVSQLGWTAAVVGLSLLWQDHRAMAVGMLVYVACIVAVTNLALPIRFGLAFDRTTAADAMRYGRPLVPNGLALAVTSLSDRLIIGGLRGLDALALYGPLSSTAMLPRATALRYVYNLFLPAMVKREEAGRSLAAPARAWFATISLLAVAFSLGFMALAEPTIALVFGPHYQPPGLLTLLMALILASRLLVTFPVPLAMACKRTWFVTGSSAIAAVALLPASIALAAASGDAVAALAAFLGGLVIVESLGAAVVILRTRRAFGQATDGMLGFAVAAASIVGVVACYCFGTDASWQGRLGPCAAGIAIAAFVFGRPLLSFLRGGADDGE
jgi:PST family polysaccharide transporter